MWQYYVKFKTVNVLWGYRNLCYFVCSLWHITFKLRETLLYSLNAHRMTECLAPSIVHDIGWLRVAANLSFYQISTQCTFSQLNQLACAGRGLATPGQGAETAKNIVLLEV